MRAYVILSNVPDIVFFSADEEYRAQLREKTRHECHPDDPSAMVCAHRVQAQGEEKKAGRENSVAYGISWP